MTFENTFKIRFNQKTIWTGTGDALENYAGCEIIETIPVVCAEDGYELWHGGDQLGSWAVQKYPEYEYSERPYEPDFEELEEMHEADL